VEEGKVIKGLYIHFPFCKRFCFYCHFVKYSHNKSLESKYIEYLIKELELKRGDFLIDSIYFGGGSPSIIDVKSMEILIDFIFKNFKIKDNYEFSIEVNPEDSSLSLFEFYKKIGINRISLGTQSFNKKDLKFLKRTHSVKDNINSLKILESVGFSNINIDFIIGLSNQNHKSIDNSIKYLKDFEINHISAYILEDVDIYQEEEFIEDIYFYMRNKLIENGFYHYEVSNYSKRGFESKHNLKYWTNREYLGVGISASGFENGIDYKNYEDFNRYFEKLDKGKLPISDSQKFNKNYRAIITGLRLLEGINIDIFKGYKSVLNDLISNEILISISDNIAINPEKILLLNEVLSRF